jgi:hypothetical protein
MNFWRVRRLLFKAPCEGKGSNRIERARPATATS